MKKTVLPLVAAAAVAAHAVDLAGLADAKFAEKYAFSADRAALIATLRPHTGEWFAYSVLHAQTEGRLEEASKLLDEWDKAGNVDRARYSAFRDRQTFLCWKGTEDDIVRMKRALGNAGIRASIPPRETEVKPDTYPSALPQDKVSFEAFWAAAGRNPHALAKGFRHIALRKDAAGGKAANPWTALSAACDGATPDVPGLLDAVLACLKDSDKGHTFANHGIMGSLTLDQLKAVADATKGTPKDVSGSAAFADAVMSRLVPAPDDDPADMEARKALLERRLAFADTLAPGLRGRRRAALRELLEFMCSRGDFSRKDLFLRYLREDRGKDGGGDAVARELNILSAAEDAFERKWLVALRMAGDGMQDFAGLVEKRALARAAAEADLLSGKPAQSVDVSAFSADAFKRLQERVELDWAGSNPAAFAADAAVSLAIDVKNVPRMRIAVYELDAAEACRQAKGAIKADIDLDCAVPTAERFADFSSVPPVVRHRETLEFPELSRPGAYVVECSGAGICSRALVRKGRLRTISRRDAAGHVFTVCGEDGRPAKDAKLWVDGMVFAADANGEISVPFAPSAKEAGEKTAVACSGRLADAVKFRHETESYGLAMKVALPAEALVAGERAAAIVRPVLSICGTPGTVELLENPSLTVTLVDAAGRESVKTYAPFKLSDGAESVCGFTVPENLQSVTLRLEGTVKRTSDGKDERLSATFSRSVNAVARTAVIGQAFLRRTAAGYVVELRGRNGEPLPSRAAVFRFRHRAVDPRGAGGRRVSVPLQADANGEISLGALEGIAEVSTDFAGGATWLLPRPGGEAALPQSISAAEGETLEIPVPGILEGGWPGAGELKSRVSLLAMAGGKPAKDCGGACTAAEGGVLRISALAPGDYVLTLHAEGVQTRISVAKGAVRESVSGAVAGAARTLPGTGPARMLAIADARMDDSGRLLVKLANAGEEARVHVIASRTARDSSDGLSAFQALAAPRAAGAAAAAPWLVARTDYISGRNLGDKLRYILDRRQEAPRIGNMLDRPSLLLNPWSTVETGTKDLAISGGEGWGDAAAMESALAPAPERARGGSIREAGRACRDFLPSACRMYANLRPGADGTVAVDMSGADGFQDVEIVAIDANSAVSRTIAFNRRPFETRDLRVKPGFDALSSGDRTKEYRTVGELFALARSIDPDDSAFAAFSFLATWNAKSEDEKRALYGEYASHELDFFIYMKDRAFFDSSIGPNLRNKRRKDFMDKWLLGEDVSEYAAPGRLQDLNALEQCLLAKRVKSAAPAVAGLLADWCAAHPPPPSEIDRRMAIALDDMGASAGGNGLSSLLAEEEPPAEDGPVAAGIAPEAPRAQGAVMRNAAWDVQSNARAKEGKAAGGPALQKQKMSAGARRSAEVARRKSYRFYSPPARTKEWVESCWYRRRVADAGIVPPCRFWSEYAAAIAAGTDGVFRSPEFAWALSTFSAKVAALAVVQVPFAADGASASGAPGVAFSRRGPEAGRAAGVNVVQHFFEGDGAARRLADEEAPLLADEDGEGRGPAEVKGEFVAGRIYSSETIVMNPTARKRRARVVSQIPAGAIPLGGCMAVSDATVYVGAYGSTPLPRQTFYFPAAGEGFGRTAPAVAIDGGAAKCEPPALPVAAVPSVADTASWDYVSQRAPKGEVLEWLATNRLEGVDLKRIGWRMVDGGFAAKALEILDTRGVYCESLWLAGLEWKDSFSEARLRQVLGRAGNLKKLARTLGPALESPILSLDPEESGAFEHREYWPIVNARAHSKGGTATITNEGLAAEWRAFLDVLAAKRAPSARDRLLAAVFLAAQDRVREAEAQAGLAADASGETEMQLDYMKAYFAFSRGEPAEARSIAQKWADAVTPLWRGRFREVVAQADEIAGKTPARAGGDAAAAMPSLALRAVAGDGSADAVAITARNLASCTLKAYPVDVEIRFSKSPFGEASSSAGAITGMKPAWTEEVSLDPDGETKVSLPRELRRANFVLTATGAGGRAEERIEITPGSPDVQVLRECRQLRLRDAAGRPDAGAYVKVYARDASNGETRFLKDGYTDMRGAFDYASVSTDSPFRPREYAVFVQSAKSGVAVLRVPAK